jgi:hypothetical protein
MNPRVPSGCVRVVVERVVAITLLLVMFARFARADNVDQLIGQLDDDSDKIRLSATLNLTKLGDQRAIPALARRLGSDSSKNVRGAAAVGLGSLVNSRTKASDRDTAVKALQRAAASDESEFVKAQAERALKAIGASAPVVNTPSGGGVYVNVGPMSSKTGTDDAKYRDLMVKTATKTFGRVASSMATTWPGGAPSKGALSQKGVQGFYIDGTLNELKVDKAGSSSKVSCKISMLLASYPDKSVFGFLSGGAAVQASASDRDIALAREDCVTAVVEDLIAKKIVPTIKVKVGSP